MSGEGGLLHRADGDRGQGSILTTQTRCGLEHAWLGGKGYSNPAQQAGSALPPGYPCGWPVADTDLVHHDKSRVLVGDQNSIEKQITEVDTLRHWPGTGREGGVDFDHPGLLDKLKADYVEPSSNGM